MKDRHIELIEEYKDDLEALCEAFLEARSKINDLESEIDVMKDEIADLKSDLDDARN